MCSRRGIVVLVTDVNVEAVGRGYGKCEVEEEGSRELERCMSTGEVEIEKKRRLRNMHTYR